MNPTTPPKAEAIYTTTATTPTTPTTQISTTNTTSLATPPGTTLSDFVSKAKAKNWADWNPVTDDRKLEIIFKKWQEQGTFISKLDDPAEVIAMLKEHFPLYFGKCAVDESRRESRTNYCVKKIRDKARTAFIAYGGCIPDL